MTPKSLRMRRLVGALTVAASVTSGCAGVDTGNGGPAYMQMALTVGEATPVDSSGAPFTVATASADVRHIELYLPTGVACADAVGLGLPAGVSCEVDRLRFTGPYRVDLKTGAATPALPQIPVPTGTYRRVDIRLDEDALTDTTIVATGTLLVAGNQRPWRMAVGLNEDLRFEGVAIEAVESAVAKALLELDMTQWFVTLPLAECAAAGALPEEGGVLILSDGDDDCVDVEDAIEAGIRGSAVLVDDDDGHSDD